MAKQVVVKNLLISYNETASGSGKTLVFLHGWRSNKEIWSTVLGQLSIVNCQSFALDLPGFGGSQTPTTPPRMHSAPLLFKEGSIAGWSVADYADVVAGFIEKLELKNVIIIGHSFGGRVGIKLSSLHPELISKLVLVDSAGFAMETSKKNLYRSLAKLVKPFFRPKMMQSLKKRIYKQIGAEDYVATPELQQTFINITSEDLSPDLKNIKAPTLIITGENDLDTPIVFGEKMHTLIPNSSFVILKNAGHFSFLDQPEEFIKILQEFIMV